MTGKEAIVAKITKVAGGEVREVAGIRWLIRHKRGLLGGIIISEMPGEGALVMARTAIWIFVERWGSYAVACHYFGVGTRALRHVEKRFVPHKKYTEGN